MKTPTLSDPEPDPLEMWWGWEVLNEIVCSSQSFAFSFACEWHGGLSSQRHFSLISRQPVFLQTKCRFQLPRSPEVMSDTVALAPRWAGSSLPLRSLSGCIFTASFAMEVSGCVPPTFGSSQSPGACFFPRSKMTNKILAGGTPHISRQVMGYGASHSVVHS